MKKLALLTISILLSGLACAEAAVTRTTVAAYGPYAQYVHLGVPYKLAVSSLLPQAALDAGHRIRVVAKDDGADGAEIDTAAGSPLPHPVIGTISVNTDGPRYAGDSVAAANIQYHGRGVGVTVNYQRGFAARDSSAGGYFHALDGTVRRVEPYGIWSLGFSDTHYLQGGPFSSLQLRGTISTTSLSLSLPVVSAALSTSLSIVHTRQDTLLGVLGWNSQIAYDAVQVCGKWAPAPAVTIKASVHYGIDGDRHLDGLPLEAYRGGGFSTYALVGTYSHALPWSMTAKATAGYQTTDPTAPPDELLWLGGPGRGSAFAPGVVSGDHGYYSRAELDFPTRYVSAPIPIRLRPYVAVDGGRVHRTTGDGEEVTLESMGAGLLLVDAKGTSMSVGYAVGHGTGIGGQHQFLLSFTHTF